MAICCSQCVFHSARGCSCHALCSARQNLLVLYYIFSRYFLLINTNFSHLKSRGTVLLNSTPLHRLVADCNRFLQAGAWYRQRGELDWKNVTNHVIDSTNNNLTINSNYCKHLNILAFYKLYKHTIQDKHQTI